LHCVDESPLLPSQFCDGRSDCSDADNIGTYIYQTRYYEIRKTRFYMYFTSLLDSAPNYLVGCIIQKR